MTRAAIPAPVYFRGSRLASVGSSARPGRLVERDERIVTIRRARRGSAVESELRLEFVW